MKKIALFLFLLPVLAVAGFAQESRQDVSVSGIAIIPPPVVGNTVHLNASVAFGGLASYRYMLTPRSALEGNYAFSQDDQHVYISSNNYHIHTRIQEISAAYVFNFNFKKFNPFLEAGIGAYIFSPIVDLTTSNKDAKKNTNIGGLYGAGIAYEISPSFDIRAEYRGSIVKAPNFQGAGNNLNTNRWYNLNIPTIGVAYHF
jgi:hypothetical protein